MSESNKWLSPERWKALEPLVDHALDLPREQRPAYIARLRQDDAALGAVVEQLVAECERPDARLDNSAPDRFGYLLDESMPSPLPAETLLAQRYRIEQEIGRGGMAIVYLANDEKLDRQVAVKLMRRTSLTTTSVRRFREEIRLTGKLRHPNIVPLYDAGESDEHAFFVMPWIEGESLRARIERGGTSGLTIQEALRIGIEIARALEYAHDHGVIHRDVKPSNLLLTSGVAMLADFGIAHAEERGDHSTEVGLRLGTPAYMSPEQVSGDVVDRQTDIYSLGCVLYEVITGAAPVPAAPRMAAMARGPDPVAPLRELRADVSPRLEACVSTAIAVEKRKRIATAGELVRRLEACARDYGVAVASWKRLYWRAPRRVAAAVGVMSILLVAAGSLLVRRAVPPAPPPAPASVTLAGEAVDTSRIVVLPFGRRGIVRDVTDEDDRMREALQRWQGIEAVDRLETREALARRDTGHLTPMAARDIGRVLRAARYVSGEVTREGDSSVIRAGLYDTRTGAALANAIVRTTAHRSSLDAAFDELADRLLFPDVVESMVTEVRAATRSRPALQAYAESRAAIDAWDLERADAALTRAINYDQRLALAYLWLAQVRLWRGMSLATWQFAVNRAAAARSILGSRDRAVVDALSSYAKNDSATACHLWRRLTIRPNERRDFAAWYAVALCDYNDHVVVRDARSPSGWAFRSSHHHATQAFRHAFEILPAVHREFRTSWYSSVKRLLRTQPSQLRFGVALPPDTGQFGAFPSWSKTGDTLEFIPYRLSAFEAGRTDVIPGTVAEAVWHQRRALFEMATTWRAAFKPNADALLAVAVALDELGEGAAALDSVQSARKLADDASDQGARFRTGAAEVWMRIKQSIPNDPTGLVKARLLADSLLRVTPRDSGAMIALASLAALTGRAHLAALYARSAGESMTTAPQALWPTLRALDAFASLGAPADSIRALATALRHATVPSGNTEDPARWMLRAVTLAFPIYRDSAIGILAGDGHYIAVAEQAWLEHDTATIRQRLMPLSVARRTVLAEDIKLERLYPEAWLLASIGEKALALQWLTPTLDAQVRASTETLRTVVGAGALIHAMALRAQLAAELGHEAESRKWAGAVIALWGEADDDLRPMLREMKQLAR
jgi:tRNA A-37 threonylcarbamoyl transferase component Bud32